MRFLLAASAWLLLAGCAAPPVPDSGAEGTVWYGPVCPVQRDPPEPECNDRLYETDLLLTRPGPNGSIVARFHSDAEGTFRVTAGPGEYTIRGENQAGPPSCSAPVFTVQAHQWTAVRVECDSGIR